MEENRVMDAVEMVEMVAEETVEKVVETSTKNGSLNKVLKIGGIAGGVVALGYVAYKFVIKPIVDKNKAEKTGCVENYYREDSETVEAEASEETTEN